MLREFFLGFVKIHILYHAQHGPIYGSAISAELRRHGYDLSPGTLYPTLHRLATAGYLRPEERCVAGRVRKYYHLTEQGAAALAEARTKMRELVDEVMRDD